MPSTSESDPRSDWLRRVNRAIDHVVENRDRTVSLEEAAAAAHLSPCHFHRVFKTVTGETLNRFQLRVRLQWAIALLDQLERSGEDPPGGRLTHIAAKTGFSNAANFSRAFRKMHGVPPSAFDLGAWRRSRRAVFEQRFQLERLPDGTAPDPPFEPRFRTLPPSTWAVRSAQDSYSPGTFERIREELLDWAVSTGLSKGPDAEWAGWTRDDPDLVPLAECRYTLGVRIPEDAAGSLGGRVNVVRFGAMDVVELDVSEGIEREQLGLDWLFGTWLPGARVDPADEPAFEVWDGLPEGPVATVRLPILHR